MKKTVTKFSSFEAAQVADDDFYRNLSYEAKLEILIQLIGHEKPEDGIVERCVRIYPVTEPRES